MAALKAVLKSLDGLADPIKALYRKEGEEFQLDVEGMVPKSQLDEFRENNLALKKDNEKFQAKLKEFDGVDLKKWSDLQETDRKVREGELVKSGKIDELFSSKLDPILKKHQEEREADKQEKARLAAQLSKVMIDQELTKLATSKGLRPEAIPDMLGRLRGDFTVVGDKVVALDSDGAMRRSDGGEPYTLERSIEGLVKTAPHLFQASNGSGAPQNQSGSGSNNGAKTMSRAEFDKLNKQNPAEAVKFLKDGGRPVDAV